MFWLHLSKDRFKFSASHFTIFSENRAEFLHGHNYYVRLRLGFDKMDSELGLSCDLNEIKKSLDGICQSLDEKILIPSKSPFLKMEKKPPQLRIQFGTRSYEFPAEEVLLLDLVNVSSELLALYFVEQLRAHWGALPKPNRIELEIEETRGQGFSFEAGF